MPFFSAAAQNKKGNDGALCSGKYTAAMRSCQWKMQQEMMRVFSFFHSRSQGSLSRLDQDGPDVESSLSKMDIVLSFTLEVKLNSSRPLR